MVQRPTRFVTTPLRRSCADTRSAWLDAIKAIFRTRNAFKLRQFVILHRMGPPPPCADPDEIRPATRARVAAGAGQERFVHSVTAGRPVRGAGAHEPELRTRAACGGDARRWGDGGGRAGLVRRAGGPRSIGNQGAT